jgi:hypothetical protein
MLNGLYGYTVNRTAENMRSVQNSDYVPEHYRPVERHSVYGTLFELYFGNEPEHQNFSALRAGCMIDSGPLRQFVSVEMLGDPAYRLALLEACCDLFEPKPVPDIGQSIPFVSSMVSDQYRLHRYQASRTLTHVQLLEAGKLISQQAIQQPVTHMPVGTGQGRVGIVVDDLPVEFQIAERPSMCLISLVRKYSEQIRQLSVRMPGLVSSLTESQQRRLIEGYLLQDDPISVGAAMILIAGHTEALSGGHA